MTDILFFFFFCRSNSKSDFLSGLEMELKKLLFKKEKKKGSEVLEAKNNGGKRNRYSARGRLLNRRKYNK